MAWREETIGDARLVSIYALCEPGGINPRYVGKTARTLSERHKGHIYDALRRPRLPVHRWIASLYRDGKWSCIKLLEWVEPGQDWQAREMHWIAEMRRQGARLLNLTDGGEGLHGIVFSQDRNAAISAKLRKGNYFSCEVCGHQFWRKPNEIASGHNRFCSHRCSNARHKGRSLFHVA